MTDEPIDFSALDPSRGLDSDGAAARWEQRIHETVEQAGLVAELDLSALQPFDAALDEGAVHAGAVHAGAVHAGAVHSALGAGVLDSSSLAPGSAGHERAVQRILATSSEPLLLRVAPRALAFAAALAAAAWLLVLLEEPPPSSSSDPAMAALSWASGGQPLSLDEMNAVTRRVDDAR